MIATNITLKERNWRETSIKRFFLAHMLNHSFHLSYV